MTLFNTDAINKEYTHLDIIEMSSRCPDSISEMDMAKAIQKYKKLIENVTYKEYLQFIPEIRGGKTHTWLGFYTFSLVISEFPILGQFVVESMHEEFNHWFGGLPFGAWEVFCDGLPPEASYFTRIVVAQAVALQLKIEHKRKMLKEKKSAK
jgi:hypothetical protein